MDTNDLAKLLGIKPAMLPPAMIPTTAELNEAADEAKNQTDKAWPFEQDEQAIDAQGNDIDFVEEGVDAAPAPVVAPTALQLDQWDINRGIDCLAASKPIQAAYPGLRMDTLTPERQAAELAMADMHGVAFLMDPQPVQACTDPRRLEFVKQLLETPECQVLRKSTVLNDLASEMAATQFGLQYVELAKADAEREKKLKETKKGRPSPERQAIQAESGLRRAVSKAISAAKEEVDSMEDCARGLGGDGSLGNTPQEAKKIAEAYRKIRGNKALKEIFNRAGAFRRFMQSAQRRKVAHGLDDVVGVVMDGEIHKLLPVEMAKLADDDYELDTLRRIVEKQAMCRQYHGTEKVARGPVVVCVDESGSMNGEPIWNAKAFALAMAVMAKQQNRWCALVGYASATEGTRLALPPGKWDQGKLMEWLAHFFSGGTDMDIPLQELPKWWGKEELSGLPLGKTDIVIITDAIVNVPKEMERTFNTWKVEHKAKVTSLIIGNDAGDLKRVSDRVFCVKGINLNEDGVAECLSL